MFKEKFPTSTIEAEKERSAKEKGIEKKEIETIDLGIEIPEEEGNLIKNL